MIEELNEYIKNFRKDINYGWYDSKNVLRTHIDKDFIMEYRMQSGEEVINSKYGICWDIVESMANYLEEKNIPYKRIFVCINNIFIKHPNHCFLITEYNNKVYWIEATMLKHLGVHEFNNIYELKKFIESIFPEIANKNIPSKYIKDIEFREYKKPTPRTKAINFFVTCYKGKII